LLLFGASLGVSKGASNVLLGLLAAGALAGALRNREFRGDLARSLRQPLTAALSLIYVVAYVGLAYTEKIYAGYGVVNKLVSLPAIYVLVSVLLQAGTAREGASRRGEALLASFLAGLAALNVLALLIFLGAIGEARHVLPLAPLGLHHIWFSNINALGLYAAAAFLLFTPAGRSLRGRALLGGFLALATACILLSTSRTAWLSIALTAGVMALVAIRSWKTIVAATLAALLTLAAVYQFVPLVRHRVDLAVSDLDRYGDDMYEESSVGGRLLLWRATLIMIRTQPLLGVGTGDFQSAMYVMRKQLRSRVVPRFLLPFNQPHNMYLFALATNGVAGLGALLYLFYRCLRLSAPALVRDGAYKLFAFVALATTVHFMIAGCLDSFFNIQVLRYSFAFVMGVCINGAVVGDPRA
jgi:O-antigen ligase